MNIGNIPPAILRSINAQPMQWKVALGEACDNSFDSRANWVRIVFHGEKQLEIIDDGDGCGSIEAMLTIGNHVRQASTKLGRFGVGLKELSCWLWGELFISTIYAGICRTALVDWERLARQPHWNVADPDEKPALAGQRGTSLRFRRTMRNRPGDLDLLSDELGYLFAPALWSGKQIAIEFGRKKITVAAWQLPEFEGEVIRDSFYVNGKRVELVAGVVTPDHTNQRKGFTFIHEHRVLLNSALGSKGKSVSRVCGTVVLGPEWKLGKNKDAIQDSDDQKDALEDAIYLRCQGVFARADRQAMMLRNSALEGAVTKALQLWVGNGPDEDETRKAKRNPRQEQTGTVSPAESGRKHRRAKVDQAGQTFKGISSMGEIRFEWEAVEDGSLGRLDPLGKVIYLNERHPRLAHHKQEENVGAIADMCCTVLVQALVNKSESHLLPCVRDLDIISAMSLVLRKQQESDDLVGV